MQVLESRRHIVQIFPLSFLFYGLLAGIILVLSGCGATGNTAQPEDIVVVPTAAPPGATVIEQLSANQEFAFFLSGINSAGLGGNLQDGGPFTLFVPTNDAFGRIRLAPTQLDPDTLQEILRHHLISRLLTEEELAAAGSVETLGGVPVNVTTNGETMMVDYAAVTGEPIQASNGVIYPIDSLLVPPETGAEKSIWGVLLEDERFSTLVEMMGGTAAMYSLRFSDDPDAFLAPTNEAFEQMPDTVKALLDQLGRGNPHYNDLFAYHIMMPYGWPTETRLSAADIKSYDAIQTGASRGQFAGFMEVDVTIDGDMIQINDGRLIETDIPAANGMVDVIDTVLIPPSLDEEE